MFLGGTPFFSATSGDYADGACGYAIYPKPIEARYPLKGQPHGIDRHPCGVLQEHVEVPEIQCTADPCVAVAMFRGRNSIRRLGTFVS